MNISWRCLAVHFVWLSGYFHHCSANETRTSNCITDEDCAPHHFCNRIFLEPSPDPNWNLWNQTCAPCVDCQSLNRISWDTCAHKLSECGSCLAGYREQFVEGMTQSRCEPFLPDDKSLLEIKNVSLNTFDDKDLAEESSSLIVSQIVILAGITLAALLAAAVSVILGRIYHRRMFQRSHNAEDRLKDFNRNQDLLLPVPLSPSLSDRQFILGER